MNNATVTVHSHDGDFTLVGNDYLRDKNLTLKAKGLLTVIFSLANNSDWDFSIRGLIKICKEGETAVYAAIKELKDNGYCKCEAKKDSQSRFLPLQYDFWDSKQG